MARDIVAGICAASLGTMYQWNAAMNSHVSKYSAHWLTHLGRINGNAARFANSLDRFRTLSHHFHLLHLHGMVYELPHRAVHCNINILCEIHESLKSCIRSFFVGCLLYTSPSQRDRTRSRMPS